MAQDSIFPQVDSAENWNAQYQRARMARMNFERRWYTYLAFVSGKQYIQWNYESTPMATGRMIEPLNPGNRVRLVINKTRRIMRKELAKINKEQIRGYVTPSNTDDDSVAAARGAEQLGDYLTDELRLAWRFKQADWWMLICGTSFMKFYYDEDIRMGHALQQVPGPMGQPIEQLVPQNGGPVVEVVDPFHILVPNLDEQDLERQEWVMHVTMKSPDWVKQRFDVAMEGVSVTTNTLESRLMSIQGMTTEADRAKAVEIREIWIKPCLKHPEGALITSTQDRILEVLDEYPYTHGKYPFVKRTYIENSIFYGATLVEDLMPLQVEYNRTRSQIVEDKNRMGRPMLAVERGSINIKALRGAAGDVVEYLPGSREPKPVPLAGLPPYIIDHVNRISVEMAELASQDDSGQNSLPAGVTAATAIAYLQESQDALVMDTLRDKEIAWELGLQQLLALVGQYWDSQRLVTVSGKNSNFETFLFSQSDLAGQTNWRAVIGSATPQSYSAKQAQIMELMKMGAIAVPEGLEYLDMGDTARLYEGMQIDKREAQKEDIRIGNGIPVPVEIWQEHLVHLQNHDDACKREEYESWTDEAKAMMANHRVRHMEMFLQEVGWSGPQDPQGMQMYAQLIQARTQSMQMSNQQGTQYAQVDPQYEMTLRSAIAHLTMAPAAEATAPPQSNTPPQGA